MSAKSTEKEAMNNAAQAAEQEKTAQQATQNPVETDTKTAGQKTKKPAAKKPAAKKTDRPEPKTEVFIEYEGQKALESEIIEKVKAAFVKDGHRVSSIKSLQIYIKPEESKAYYVINDNKFNGDIDLY